MEMIKMIVKHVLKCRYKNVIITVQGNSRAEASAKMTQAGLAEGCKFKGCSNCSDDQLHIIEAKVLRVY
jgi:hypothetical protein